MFSNLIKTSNKKWHLSVESDGRVLLRPKREDQMGVFFGIDWTVNKILDLNGGEALLRPNSFWSIQRLGENIIFTVVREVSRWRTNGFVTEVTVSREDLLSAAQIATGQVYQ